MSSRFTKIVCLALALILSFTWAGCSKQAGTTKDEKVIKLGTLAVNGALLNAVKDKLIEKGYKVEVKIFDGNNMPAIATRDGDIDGFITNHLPWINTFNKENNSKLIMVEPYLFYMRSGLYSAKYKNVSEFPNGARIAIPNDPTNLQESLLMLQKCGLLTLGPKTGNFYTELDIKDNPKNIKLIGTEISVTGRSINDADAVICSSYQVKGAGIDPMSFLAEDLSKVNFPIGFTVDEKSLNEPWVKDAMQILTSDTMKDFMKKEYGGTIVLYER